MSVSVDFPPIKPLAVDLGLDCRRRKKAVARTTTTTVKTPSSFPEESLRNQIMLSEPVPPSSNGVLRRDSLTLSFNRSISDPHHPHHHATSSSPSLHPSKRSRMEPPTPSMTSSSSSYITTSTTAAHSVRASIKTPPGTVSLPTSPCSESSTLQRSLLLQKATTIQPDQLATRLSCNNNVNAFLLVDCRPFIAYNVNHISGAINVNCCDRFNRKRLQQGKASLADLATTKEGKEMLKRRSWKEVIVYDDCSESLDKLPVSHTLFLVMNALVEDNREPIMLLGGLRDFQVTHRTLCEDHLMTGSPKTYNRCMDQLLPDLPSPSELCDTKDIENHPATRVLPYLYLGNMRDASDPQNLHDLGIKYVLNVTAKPPDYVCDPTIIYKQLEAADNGVQNLRQFFEEAFEFIDRARDDPEGKGVLIHCHAGVSRSPTIAIAYLMKYYSMAMSDAYKFVKTKRSIISPNLNFMGQLWEFEQGLKGENGSPNAKQTVNSVNIASGPHLVSPSSSTLSSTTTTLTSSSRTSFPPCDLVDKKSMNSFKWSNSGSVHTTGKTEEVGSGCSV